MSAGRSQGGSSPARLRRRRGASRRRRDRRRTSRSTSRAAGRARRPAGRAARRASTPGRRHCAPTGTATRSPPATTACCSSTSPARRRRVTRACWRRRCARSSARSAGARTGSCSRPAGATPTSPGCCDAARRSPRRSALSDFELPAIDDYHVCLHLACDDERAARRGRGGAAPRFGPLAGARRPAADLRRADAGARRARASPERACPPPHQRVGGIPAGDPVADERAAVHGLQVGPTQQPGDRGGRHDRRRPVRRRHDDARQLHAAAARQLVPAADRGAANRADVLARRRRPPTSRASRPTPSRTPASSARRSRATASSATPRPLPGAAARQATDHPPRLRHRRRRAGRTPLRLACSARSTTS